MKQEPSKYSWNQFVNDTTTYWDGVRNFQARNNLMAMKKNDLVFFYHSVSDKQIMGIARVTKEYYSDPTTKDDRWVAVDLQAVKTLKTPVSLDAIKIEPRLNEIALIRQSRLSVMPLKKTEFKTILNMGNTKLPGI